MTNLGKGLLIGLGIVGAVSVVALAVTAKKKQAVYISPEGEVEGAVAEEPGFMDKIKDAAEKKAIRILGWVMLHKNQIEAVGTVIAVTASIFKVVNEVKEYHYGKELHAKLDAIVKHNNEFRDIWNEYMMLDNDNNHYLNDKLNAIHLDMSMLHEIHENLVPNAA